MTNPLQASQAHAADFEQVLTGAGIPTTEAGIKAEFKTLADGSDLGINNDENISPFWRIVTALMITPAHWLMRFVIEHILPNSFLKTAGTTTLDILAWGVGLTRFEATKAQGYLTFYRANSTGSVTIPAGTQINTRDINGRVYSVTTLADGNLTDGEYSKAVLCEATETGTDHNLGANYYTIPAQPIAGIDSVTNAADWLTKQGKDIEADNDLRERARNQFNSVNQWHTDSVYKSIVSAFTELNTNQIYLRTQAPRGPGTADILILFKIGEPSADYCQAIEDHINSNKQHGLGDDIEVKAMPALMVDLVVNVQFISTVSDTEKANLLSNVEQFIRAAFRENTTYSPTVTEPYKPFAFSRLGMELHQQFNEIESIRFDRETIEQNLNIGRLNSLTVTNND